MQCTAHYMHATHTTAWGCSIRLRTCSHCCTATTCTVYMYVIVKEDKMLQSNEMCASLFVDHASKHAQPANCALCVLSSGEFKFHPHHTRAGG